MFKKIYKLSLWHVVVFWAVGGVALFAVSYFASAQTSPQILVTWRAESYAPPAYRGKILPTANSPITVSFEVLDAGKPANLSKQIIYWYLNNDLIENRNGVQSVTFNAPARAPSILELRIELPAYPGGLLLKTITIPVVSPEVVIEAPYPDKNFSAARIQALGTPYFFNIQNLSDLSFVWNIDGRRPQSSEEPRKLAVNLDPNTPIGSTINIALSVVNNKQQPESASQFLILRLSQ